MLVVNSIVSWFSGLCMKCRISMVIRQLIMVLIRWFVMCCLVVLKLGLRMMMMVSMIQQLCVMQGSSLVIYRLVVMVSVIWMVKWKIGDCQCRFISSMLNLNFCWVRKGVMFEFGRMGSGLIGFCVVWCIWLMNLMMLWILLQVMCSSVSVFCEVWCGLGCVSFCILNCIVCSLVLQFMLGLEVFLWVIVQVIDLMFWVVLVVRLCRKIIMLDLLKCWCRRVQLVWVESICLYNFSIDRCICISRLFCLVCRLCRIRLCEVCCLLVIMICWCISWLNWLVRLCLMLQKLVLMCRQCVSLNSVLVSICCLMWWCRNYDIVIE